MKIRVVGTQKEIDAVFQAVASKFGINKFRQYNRTPTRYSRVQKPNMKTAYADLTLLKTIARKLNAMRKKE